MLAQTESSRDGEAVVPDGINERLAIKVKVFGEGHLVNSLHCVFLCVRHPGGGMAL